MSKVQEFMRLLLTNRFKNADEASIPDDMSKEDFIESLLQEAEEASQQQTENLWNSKELFSGEFLEKHGLYITEEDEPWWHEALAATEAFYNIVFTFVEDYRENISNDEDFEEGPVDLALDYMHMRMCQHFVGILISLRHGFAENALTLWHKMYEILCFAYLIHTSTTQEKLADAYLKYTHTEDGSHSWAKFDKRLSSVKGAAIPFARVENICGVEIVWPKQERFFYSHFDIRKDGAKHAASVMPDIFVEASTEFLAIPALQAVKTLALLTGLLVIGSFKSDTLPFLRFLEIYQEKLGTLFERARNADSDIFDE